MNNKINLTNNETIDIEAAKEEVGGYQQVIGANLHSMHIKLMVQYLVCQQWQKMVMVQLV